VELIVSNETKRLNHFFIQAIVNENFLIWTPCDAKAYIEQQKKMIIHRI